MASLSEIAKHASVSKSTVSLVLNNKPNVSASMKSKVMQAINELDPGFRNGRIASGKKPAILLIHPLSMSSHQVFRELLQGVKTAVIDEALGNLTLAAHNPPLKPNHATSALIHDPLLKPDGVLLMGALEDDPIFDDILSENLPCVLLARQHGPQGASVVGMDNRAGIRSAVEYLLLLGHQKIAFIGGDSSYDYTELRTAGYLEKMAEEGLAPYVYSGDSDEAITRMLAQAPDGNSLPTALVFVNDEYALQGIKRLKEAGLRVPEDISATGFDDSENATDCEPQLTSVRVPRFQIGKLAGRTLLDHISTPELERVAIVLRTTLTVRDSARRIIMDR